LEFAVGMGLFESLQKEAAEQAAEHAHREEEARTASRPLAVERESSTRHDAVS
jgi:hypothetical protein